MARWSGAPLGPVALERWLVSVALLGGLGAVAISEPCQGAGISKAL